MQHAEEVDRAVLADLILDNPDRYRAEYFEGKDIGLVATRDYAIGELVMAEAPVLTFRGSDPNWKDAVLEQFKELPRMTKVQVQDLACVKQDELEDQQKFIGGILHANQYERGMDSKDGVLCLGISRFNHSCNPNIEQSWNEESGELEMRATRKIDAGEELCSYFIDIRAGTEERLAEIKKVYKFHCMCEACQRPSEESDERRREMRRCLQELEQIGGRDPVRGLEVLEKLVGHYESEKSFPGIYLKQAYYLAYQFALMAGAMQDAKKLAELAAEWSTRCHGESHIQTQRLLRYAKFPRSHRAFKVRELVPYV